MALNVLQALPMAISHTMNDPWLPLPPTPTAVAAWENRSMGPLRASLFSRRVQASVIAVLVVLLAIFTWITPPHAEVLHNILHHLNILPFMLAGLLFGPRGALRAVLLATMLQAPSIHRHWYIAPLDAQDQIVELSTFGAAGVIAGILADRERTQRRRVEATRLELETVHSELRKNVEHLRKTERLTAAGRLAASLAHEIRNPLASISGAAGILARGVAPATSRQECTEILTKESQRLNKLLTNFLDFARPRLPRLQWIDPVALIESVLSLAQHANPGRHVLQERGAATNGAEVHWDSEQITQVLLNLVLNALQATTDGGQVTITSSSRDTRFLIQITDTGVGIRPDDLDHLFDPFFTTREHGTGLGLAIAANIVAQHNGQLTCRSEGPGRGSTFLLDLPCSPDGATPSSPQSQAATA